MPCLYAFFGGALRGFPTNIPSKSFFLLHIRKNVMFLTGAVVAVRPLVRVLADYHEGYGETAALFE